jgi:hypothetical protein
MMIQLVSFASMSVMGIKIVVPGMERLSGLGKVK